MLDFLSKIFSSTPADQADSAKAVSKGGQAAKAEKGASSSMKILKKGPAMRVIFFYPGEEGTYVDNAEVVLYENGIIHIKSNQEETTTHLQNCEILWRFETETDDRANKVRLLKPKGGSREETRGDGPGPDRSPEA